MKPKPKAPKRDACTLRRSPAATPHDVKAIDAAVEDVCAQLAESLADLTAADRREVLAALAIEITLALRPRFG